MREIKCINTWESYRAFQPEIGEGSFRDGPCRGHESGPGLNKKGLEKGLPRKEMWGSLMALGLFSETINIQ